MHLASFRKGWESERLAEFLLSRIAFVSSPTTIADDVGTDFYCTLFESIKVESHVYLQPRLAVAVQVKSAGSSTIDLTDKIKYLENLELPYILGIVDRSSTTLCLYSGCYLPLVFSQFGPPSILNAVLSPQMNSTFQGPSSVPDPSSVPFPLLATLGPSDSDLQLANSRSSLIAHCSKVGAHVRSRLASDYLFQFDNIEYVFAGSGSARTFRNRLLGRLAESLYNLDWLSVNQQPVPISERTAILSLVSELQQNYTLPLTLQTYLSTLR